LSRNNHHTALQYTPPAISANLPSSERTKNQPPQQQPQPNGKTPFAGATAVYAATNIPSVTHHRCSTPLQPHPIPGTSLEPKQKNNNNNSKSTKTTTNQK
jgi:hypothetical protein